MTSPDNKNNTYCPNWDPLESKRRTFFVMKLGQCGDGRGVWRGEGGEGREAGLPQVSRDIHLPELTSFALPN